MKNIPTYEPFVSVIVPNYNYARFLNRRIDCILNQTYQNFELIILDDCSTDNSKDIIESYRGHSRVSAIVYNLSNSGSTFKQWKKGLDLAKGDLIWIAEADDYSSNAFLERIVPHFEDAFNVGAVYCYSQDVDDSGKEIAFAFDKHQANQIYEGLDFITSGMNRYTAIRNVSSAVVRKSVADEIGDDYSLMKAAGDRLFWIKIAERSNIVYINEKLNFWRFHDSEDKVSPKKSREGTTLNENYLIDQYLIKKGYLKGWNKIGTLCFRFQEIYSSDFDSEEIRELLIKKYRPFPFFNKFFFRILARLYFLHIQFDKFCHSH